MAEPRPASLRAAHPALRTLAENLAGLRRAAGLSQRALAARARVSPGLVAMIERARRTPALPVVLRLSEALGVPPARLVDPPRAGPLELPDRVVRLVLTRRPSGEALERLLLVARAALTQRRGRRTPPA